MKINCAREIERAWKAFGKLTSFMDTRDSIIERGRKSATSTLCVPVQCTRNTNNNKKKSATFAHTQNYTGKNANEIFHLLFCN